MIPPNYANQDKGNQSQGPSNTPTPPPPPAKSNTNKVILPVLISVGFILLVAAAWLTYNSINSTRMLEQKVAELEEAERLKSELDTQYNQAIADLEKMKGDNAQINAMIEQQKAELAEQKVQITELLKEKKLLDAARTEIRSLKNKVAQYIAEIEQLKSEQEQLSQQNMQLKEETQTLSTNLQTQSVQNEELQTVKAKLVNEREELTRSVQLGSVIKVKDIKVTGQKLRGNGKTATKEKAKRVDQLKVCFTTISNEIVKPGTEKFFIRIISPKGETLAIDDLGAGSGSTVDHKTGEEVAVSEVQEYNYANDEAELCFLWNPSMPFQSGKYDVEIYNKGYIAGKGSFELK